MPYLFCIFDYFPTLISSTRTNAQDKLTKICMVSKSADDSFIHSFIHVRNREVPFPLHIGLSPSLRGEQGRPELQSQEQLWLGGCPGSCTCAAHDVISPLEPFFPTKRLVIKSLFAAPDSRSHKPLTSSRHGVRSAWVLNRGLAVRNDFQKSSSASATKGRGWGQGSPHLARQQGERLVPGGVEQER